MLSAAFRQYLADRWLLNGRINSGTSEMDGTEPIELIEDDREDNEEGGESGIDGTDEASNQLPQPHVGVDIVVLCSRSWPDDLRSQCFSENIALSVKAQ